MAQQHAQAIGVMGRDVQVAAVKIEPATVSHCSSTITRQNPMNAIRRCHYIFSGVCVVTLQFHEFTKLLGFVSEKVDSVKF